VQNPATAAAATGKGTLGGTVTLGLSATTTVTSGAMRPAAAMGAIVLIGARMVFAAV
jgi:hypothetical protein